MKYRTGFVSNSSSASFVVALCILTPEQIAQAKDYYNVILEMTYAPKPGDQHWEPRIWKERRKDVPFGTYLDKSWHIEEKYGMLTGETSMDNLDFTEFLVRIGVPREAIHYSGGG